jgi:hypothetical protein
MLILFAAAAFLALCALALYGLARAFGALMAFVCRI